MHSLGSAEQPNAAEGYDDEGASNDVSMTDGKLWLSRTGTDLSDSFTVFSKDAVGTVTQSVDCTASILESWGRQETIASLVAIC